MKEVYLITNNTGKVLAANKAFENSGIELKQLKGDFAEIQASSSLEIAKFTAKQVAKEKNLSEMNVQDFILIGYAIGERKLEQINSKNELIDLLKEHSEQNPEIIGNEYEFKIIKNRKLEDSFKINFD